jgi:thioredoxin reductase
MHNVPTWDHRDSAEFRAKAKADLLARYDTIQFKETLVESIQRTNTGHFEAIDSEGVTWTGKKVVLATGAKDIYPDIPGYDDVWGRGV